MCKGLRPINQESLCKCLYGDATAFAFGDRLDRGALLKGQYGEFPSPEKSRAFANPRHMQTRTCIGQAAPCAVSSSSSS